MQLRGSAEAELCPGSLGGGAEPVLSIHLTNNSMRNHHLRGLDRGGARGRSVVSILTGAVRVMFSSSLARRLAMGRAIVARSACVVCSKGIVRSMLVHYFPLGTLWSGGIGGSTEWRIVDMHLRGESSDIAGAVHDGESFPLSTRGESPS